MEGRCYYYLHTNGSLIKKSAAVCELFTTPQETFDSPFVVKWWRIENHEQYKAMEKEIENLTVKDGE